MVKAFFPTMILAMLVMATLILSADAAFAQPALPNDPAQAPIGPGLGALAVAGGAYAIRKLRSSREEQGS